MGFISDIFGEGAKSDLFGGGDPEIQQQSGFGALPGFAQQGFQELVGRGLETSRQAAPFAPTAFTTPQVLAIETLATPGGVVPIGSNFRLGGRGSEALEAARTTFGGIMPGLERSLGRARGFVDTAGANIGRGARDITGAEFGTALSSFTSPFTQQVLDPALRDIREQTQTLFSDIGAQATGAGAFGGTRQALLESEAARAGAREAGRLSGQLRQQGFESAADRALRTLEANRARALQGAGLNISQAQQALAGGQLGAQTGLGVARGLGDLGASLFQQRQRVQDIRRDIREQQLADARAQLAAGTLMQQQQQQAQQIPVRQLQFLGQTLGTFPTGSVRQTPPESFLESPGGRALISAGTAALMGMSDERYKEDIKYIGQRKGHNIYEFKYKDLSGKLKTNKEFFEGIYQGVMAQEVEKTNPEAVKEINGIKFVDYEMIGIPFERVG